MNLMYITNRFHVQPTCKAIVLNLKNWTKVIFYLNIQFFIHEHYNLTILLSILDTNFEYGY